MHKNYLRIVTVFATSVLLVSMFSIQAFAAGTEMENMGKNIMSWYRLIRNNIAVPLLIVSFASCGFKILFSGFNAGGDRAISEATTHFFTSMVALIVLFVLPYLIGSARQMLESTGWKPPTTSVIIPFRHFL